MGRKSNDKWTRRAVEYSQLMQQDIETLAPQQVDRAIVLNWMWQRPTGLEHHPHYKKLTLAGRCENSKIDELFARGKKLNLIHTKTAKYK